MNIIEELNERFKSVVGTPEYYDYYKEGPQKGQPIYDLGLLKLGNSSYYIVSDYDAIYANNLPILFNYNDVWTAIGVAKDLLGVLFKDNFTPAE